MIERQLEDGILLLTLDHGKVNAMDLELLQAFEPALGDLEEVDAIVLTGRGRAFSAGVDLFRILEGGREYTEEFMRALSRVIRSFFEIPRPVVAALNGHAIAGGCILAAAADERWMAAGSARIGVPELLVGVPFPVMPLEALRFAVGDGPASALVFSGATLLPEEAERRSLVHGVVDADRLLSHALERARALAAIPRRSFSLTKEILRRPALDRVDALADLTPQLVDQWCDRQVLDQIRAYLKATLGRGK